MKSSRSLTVAVLLIAVAVWNSRGAEVNHEADHAALRQLRDKVTAAINNQDVQALQGCFAKEFAFTTVTQTVLTNQAQIQGFFDRMFRAQDAPLASMKSEPSADILTRFLDDRTGVCYGSAKDTYTLKSGDVVTMNLRWSATVVKEGEQWKVALAHVGTDFMDNPVLTRLSAFWRNVSIGAGMAGLVLGGVAGAFLARRKK